jgi:class 3 adenylate cyclase
MTKKAFLLGHPTKITGFFLIKISAIYWSYLSGVDLTPHTHHTVPISTKTKINQKYKYIQPLKEHTSTRKHFFEAMGEGIEGTLKKGSSCLPNDISGALKNDRANRLSGNRKGYGSPEALVHREDQAIFCLKVLFVLVLLFAASSVTSTIFILTRDSQRRSFESDFAFIGQSMAETLVDDVAAVFEAGRSISTSLSVIMAAYNSSQITMSVPIPMFSSLTYEAVQRTSFASWNPLIRNDEERRQFEEMVTAREEEGYFSDGINPPCFVCGDAAMTPSKPSAFLTFPGIGSFACGTLDVAGRASIIPENACAVATQTVLDKCACSHSGLDFNATKLHRTPSRGLFRVIDNANPTIVDEAWTGGPYLPVWLDRGALNSQSPLLFNHLSHPKSIDAVSLMLAHGNPQVTRMYDRNEPHYYNLGLDDRPDQRDQPASTLFSPVVSPYRSEIVGAVSFHIRWAELLRKKIPDNGEFVSIIIESSCGDVHTFNVHDGKMRWIGKGDFHDARYDRMMRRTSYDDFRNLAQNSVGLANGSTNATQANSCAFQFLVFPTSQFEAQYITNDPWLNSMSVVAGFAFTSALFLLYDYIVRRRQAKVMKSAKQTSDIVVSLIPDAFRNRLYEQMNSEKPANDASLAANTSKSAMRSFLAGSTDGTSFDSNPIADFFPSCTVIFIDIANFTAWCSEREPSQVFILLENLYHSFDQVAEQLGVFKVETIGDSYVAVCGLPTPRDDHAEMMARFAHLCLSKMRELVKTLEVTLGPSTGDLFARCGMHSGPVTAGVLRGTKARFQLFGDTVNTASRMESTGIPGRIHASEQTIALLNKSNKGAWILPRDEVVHVKGKGILQTYWLDPRGQTGHSTSTESADSYDPFPSPGPASGSFRDMGSIKNASTALFERKQRLIEWNVEVLHELLTRVATRRAALQAAGSSTETTLNENTQLPLKATSSRLVIDEMTEVVTLPKFDPAVHRESVQAVLPEIIRDQLREYVSRIARSYRQVPFHNFEHASHVIMSATKLMKRIMSPEGLEYATDATLDDTERQVAKAHKIHQVTYGMSSDPLMQFSVVFSALIHDVDHTGLTNKELVDMKASVANTYGDKCVAEQNSVDVAWRILMENDFLELRACIFTTPAEERRFRELVVDAVLATDIADKELGTLRKNRWEQAFAENPTTDFDVDRKATIVFEHIIQASDVCHTMQHWHTYQKFNARLFEERYLAYRKGVAGENPPWIGWYNGEIWFFDNYIIPLARKLNDCGVFGVSYHEYLSYAEENRAEWERKGHEIVEGLRRMVESKYESLDMIHLSDPSGEA